MFARPCTLFNSNNQNAGAVVSISSSSDSNVSEVKPVDLSEKLRMYIRKNTKFPDLFKRCDDGEFNDELKVIMGMVVDPTKKSTDIDTFLSHQHRIELVIYLMERKKINYWSGLSIYAYLNAINDFGRDNVTLVDLISDNQLTSFGNKYISLVVKKLPGLIDCSDTKCHELENKLKRFLLDCCQIDRCVIEIAFKDKPLDFNERILALDIGSHLPFVMRIDGYGRCIDDLYQYSLARQRYSYICLSMANYLFSQLSDRPMKMLPVFGRVSTETLLQLHMESYHPTSLVAPSVKNNIEAVHDHIRLPFLILLHDVGHTFWANLLTFKERSDIFNLIRDFQGLRKQYENNSKVSLLIDVICDGLNDFNLTPLNIYLNPNSRLGTYLMNQLPYEICAKLSTRSFENNDLTLTSDSLLKIVKEYISENCNAPQPRSKMMLD